MNRLLYTWFLILPSSAHARVVVTEDTWWVIPVHIAGAFIALRIADRPSWFWGPFSVSAGWLAALVAWLMPAAKNNEWKTSSSSPEVDSASAQTRQQPAARSTLPAQAVAGEARESDEDLWHRALAEFESDLRRPGLWAKVYSQSGGSEAVAKASYLRLRYEELRVELDEFRQEARRAAYVAEQHAEALIPRGTCPSCDSVLPLTSEECPHCKALFGPRSAWSIKPLAGT
jgi:hypothetical protein